MGMGTPPNEISGFIKELKAHRKAFHDSGSAVNSSALQEVEQEREVAFEVEAVHEVQKPVIYVLLKFPGFHPDILRFIETGRLALDVTGVENIFMALKRTSIGRKYGITSHAANSQLYVSNEFMKTVQLPGGQPNDNLMRPVTWVLWSAVTQRAIVIIPEEAETIIPLLRDETDHGVYLLTYSAPLTRGMAHFSYLAYYTIPSLPKGWQPPTWLRVELGILAGRVYFDFAEYASICEFLGIQVHGNSTTAVETPEWLLEDDEPYDDASKPTDDGQREVKAESFTPKPLFFLQEWIAVRRRGQDFTHIPMGYVCQEKPLDEDHPFFSRRPRQQAGSASSAAKKRQSYEVGKVEGADADEFTLLMTMILTRTLKEMWKNTWMSTVCSVCSFLLMPSGWLL